MIITCSSHSFDVDIITILSWQHHFHAMRVSVLFLQWTLSTLDGGDDTFYVAFWLADVVFRRFRPQSRRLLFDFWPHLAIGGPRPGPTCRPAPALPNAAARAHHVPISFPFKDLDSKSSKNGQKIRKFSAIDWKQTLPNVLGLHRIVPIQHLMQSKSMWFIFFSRGFPRIHLVFHLGNGL